VVSSQFPRRYRRPPDRIQPADRQPRAQRTEETIQRITTENTTLKQRVQQLTTDNRTLDERLKAGRSNIRFQDRRIADVEAQLADPTPRTR
jgi:predicted RNase H-like nuclease (RuvC/YqgF family)